MYRNTFIGDMPTCFANRLGFIPVFSKYSLSLMATNNGPMNKYVKGKYQYLIPGDIC